MKVMKYFCDHCGKEVESSKNLTDIKITVRCRESIKEGCYYPNEDISICGDCLIDIGFVKEKNSITNPFKMIKRLLKKNKNGRKSDEIL